MGGTLSRPDPSRMPVVIGAGYSRTGTSSMQLALERLVDGPVYHGGTQTWLSGDDARVKLWGQACDAKFVARDKELTMKLVREAVKGYAGLVDAPAIWLLPEILEICPDAQVVLNTRDPERWWKSFENLFNHVPLAYFTVLTAVRPGIRWIPRSCGGTSYLRRDCCAMPAAIPVSMDRVRYPTLPTSSREMVRSTDRAQVILELYQQHVIDIVPKDKLLIMDLKEGWEPMASFLEKDVPKEQFPRVNESAVFDKQAKSLFRMLVLTWAGVLAATGGSAYLVWSLAGPVRKWVFSHVGA
ncbi:hypothetical protein PMZ80_009170 [Knufia obscura]|uniref:Uncharacterized protein n=1 Tax=Knufia obscura TaxID=1635080 RepID=A0ABR0RFE0_9EURO|nr:hypothetical protein PMZ80_009170 [Knufia obscura]